MGSVVGLILIHQKQSFKVTTVGDHKKAKILNIKVHYIEILFFFNSQILIGLSIG